MVYLYTLPGCDACERARALVSERGYTPVVVPIDNPLLELGVKLLFNNRLHAPVIVFPEQGIYILSQDDPPQLLRVVNLVPDTHPAEPVKGVPTNG